jgi:replicative DNA helicase
MGKSILAMQLGLMAVIEGRQAGVAIYSLEMRELQLMLRCISALAKIPTHRLKSGKMQPDDWILFAQTVGDAESLPVYVYPRAELTTDQLRSDLKRLRARYGVKIFVLDYLHLMTDELKNQNDVERSGYLSRKISAIAKDLGMIGITVDSVTKEGMGSNGNGFEPSMKILRGSGQLMHDADNVFYLSQSQAAPDFRDLYLLKGREITASGKAKITLRKNPEYPWFENAVTKQLVAEMLR